jgi:ribosomal protein S18 acetylase RimI-like enzyme
MPAIHVRPATADDIPWLMSLDHSYTTEFVWQMELQVENGQVTTSFRETRLPRTVQVDYPRHPETLADDWTQRSALLVAEIDGVVAGYISLAKGLAPNSLWVTDLAVVSTHRRRGVGTALLLSAQKWAAQLNSRRIFLEMQSKNYPAIRLAQKMGYEFCGYSDGYYTNQDIALFFARTLR